MKVVTEISRIDTEPQEIKWEWKIYFSKTNDLNSGYYKMLSLMNDNGLSTTLEDVKKTIKAFLDKIELIFKGVYDGEDTIKELEENIRKELKEKSINKFKGDK